MKERKQISYEEIVEMGLSLLKDETEVIYGTSDKDKAESVMRMCGIIDFLCTLDDATQVTSNPDTCKLPVNITCKYEE